MTPPTPPESGIRIGQHAVQSGQPNLNDTMLDLNKEDSGVCGRGKDSNLTC